MKFIKKHLKYISIALFALSSLSVLAGGFWAITAVLVVGFHTYLAVKVYGHSFTTADYEYWLPPAELIKETVPRLMSRLAILGYSRDDYQSDRHDCDDYALAGAAVMHDILLEATKEIPEAQGKALPIFQFSFTRDDKKRHRLFFVIDNKEKRHYIESYPVFDKNHDKSGMYRLLTSSEEMNGYII